MNVVGKRVVWLVGIAGLSIACVALSRQLAVERTRTHLETDRVTRLQARIASLQKPQGDSTPRERPTADASARPAANTQPATTAPVTQAARKVDPNIEVNRRREAMRKAYDKMRADPESRKLMLSEMKTNLRVHLSGVGRYLSLSAEGQDQLLELLAEQQMQMGEKASRMRESGAPFSPEDYENQRKVEAAELTALLGTQRYQQFKEFTESLGERRRVMDFQASLEEANALKDDDAERLITALAQERKRMQDVAREKMKNDSTGRHAMFMSFANGVSLTLDDTEPAAAVAAATSQIERFDQQMRQVAAPLLTAAQIKAFEDFQAQQREVQLAQFRMNMLQMQRPSPAAKQ